MNVRRTTPPVYPKEPAGRGREYDAAYMQIVASFRISTQQTIFHVVRGDALLIDADLAVLGRAPEVRRKLVERGATFYPLSADARRFVHGQMHRQVLEAVVPNGCWRHVFAINYRPGHNNRLEFRSPCGAVGTHPANLAFNLSGLLTTYAASGARGSRFLFLPLSWRNPTVVCAAAVAACYGFAVLWKRHEPPGGWQFVLCDQADPAPFLPVLRNEGDSFARFVGHTGLVGTSYYRQHPIEEIPAPL